MRAQRWRYGNLHIIKEHDPDPYKAWLAHNVAQQLIIESIPDPKRPPLPVFFPRSKRKYQYTGQKDVFFWGP